MKKEKNWLPPLQLLPDWVRDYIVTCHHCQFKGPLSPDAWFQKYERESFTFSAPHLSHLNRQVLVNPPTVKCPKCDSQVFVVPPLKDEIATVELNADETNRDIGNGQWVYVFAAVGAERHRTHELNQKLWELKRELEPTRDPSGWHIHMKIIHSGDHRKRHLVMKDWDRTKVDRAKNGAFEILRSTDSIHKFVAVVSHPNQEQWAKESAFYMLALRTVDALANIGRGVELRFDSQKEVKPGSRDGAPVPHQWAMNVAKRFRNTMLYQFLTRLLEVSDPVFVKPGSQPAAELADVVAFVVGRAYEQKAQGKALDYDPAVVGVVNWIGFARGEIEGTRVVTPQTTGVPWVDMLP